jgi:hypothetical protein
MILELLTGNIVICEADYSVYVVLRKEENYVHYGELVGTADCVALYSISCGTSRGRYSRVRL